MTVRKATEAAKWPLIGGIAIFLILIAISGLILRERYFHLGHKQSHLALAAAGEKAVELEQILREVATATTTVGFLVERPGTEADFDRISSQILYRSKTLDGLALTTNGAITHYFPATDIHRECIQMAENAVAKSSAGAMVDALVTYISVLPPPGDSSRLVGSLPLRKGDQTGRSVLAVVNPQKLVRTTDQDAQYFFQISTFDSLTGAERFLLRPGKEFDTGNAGYITMRPEMSGTAWRVYVMPRNKATLIEPLSVAGGILLSLLGAYLAWYLMAQPYRLTRLVAAKAGELGIAEGRYQTLYHQLEAFFENVEGAACLLDAEMRFVVFNRQFIKDHQLQTDISPSVGMEIFLNEPEKAERRQLLQQVLEGQKRVFEASFERNGKLAYFRTSCTPVMSGDRVIGISMYSIELTGIRETEHELREINKELGERIKELRCLYRISELANNYQEPFEHLMDELVTIIPQAWQFPELACAKVILGNESYFSANFCESEWEQSARIMAGDLSIGSIKVYYREQAPAAEEGPFLAEERNLINLIAGLIGNVVEKRNARDNNIKLSRLYQFSSAINEAMLRAIDEAEIYQAACRIAVAHGNYRMAWIGRLDPESERILPFGVAGYHEGFLKKVKASLHDSTLSRIPSIAAMRTRTFQYSSDIAQDPAMGPWREEALKRGYRASISLPLIVDSQLIAVFTLYRPEPFSFNDDEIGLLQGVVDNISYAIDNLRIKEARRQYLEKLSESEELFRKLSEETPLGVYILQDEKFSYANPGLRAITGYSSEQFRNLPFEKLVHRDDIENVWSGYLSSISGEVQTKQSTIKILTAAGLVRHAELITSLIKYHGRPAIIGTVVDITEKVEEEKRFNLAVSEAQELERITIGMELHDNVKQMMATSLLSLHMAKAGLEDNHGSTQYLDMAQGQIRDAVLELRKISHQLAPSVDSELPFEEKVASMLEGTNISDKLAVSYDFRYSEDHLSSSIQIALYRIIQEQLSNVLKYARASSLQISLVEDRSMLVLTVTDNGDGFDTGQQRMGIGLENIKRRARALDGHIDLRSAPGAGCTLSVRIPY